MANHDKRIIPYGLNLNSIPEEDPNCKALILVSDATPSLPFQQGLIAIANPTLLN
jgi:hypothetical protein